MLVTIDIINGQPATNQQKSELCKALKGLGFTFCKFKDTKSDTIMTLFCVINSLSNFQKIQPNNTIKSESNDINVQYNIFNGGMRDLFTKKMEDEYVDIEKQKKGGNYSKYNVNIWPWSCAKQKFRHDLTNTDFIAKFNTDTEDNKLTPEDWKDAWEYITDYELLAENGIQLSYCPDTQKGVNLIFEEFKENVKAWLEEEKTHLNSEGLSKLYKDLHKHDCDELTDIQKRVVYIALLDDYFFPATTQTAQPRSSTVQTTPEDTPEPDTPPPPPFQKRQSNSGNYHLRPLKF